MCGLNELYCHWFDQTTSRGGFVIGSQQSARHDQSFKKNYR